jgi:hypothetical protein
MANHSVKERFEVTAEMWGEALARIEDLTKKLDELGNRPQAPARNNAQREMTDDDARRIMNGDLRDAAHNEAASKLGLSYGQVYSARLGYTFKHIHKELSQDPKYRNKWIKA